MKDYTELLTLARDRHTFALAVDKDDRRDAEEDGRFSAAGALNQWRKEDADARAGVNRPVLQWNRLGVFTAQVVNDGRQNKPAIKISAMDDGTKPTAEFFQARIRHIEYDSDADIAYDSSREQQIVTGRGFYRIRTKRKRKSHDQELRIERIENQFSVLFDPAAVEYDRADADYCFVIAQISKDEFQRKYGKDREPVIRGWYADSENPAPEWIGVGSGGELIQIAEYWLKEYRKRTLCKLMDGSYAWEDELEGGSETIVGKTEEDDYTVKQYVINGVEVLDETEWIGHDIPIIPVWGREQVVDGRRHTTSLIRNAKDPQRLVNLYVSNIAEQIAMMPKSPYMVAEGQIENHEQEWAEINISPKSYVTYKPRALDGSMPGPPQRIITEPPIQALVVGLNQSIDAIKASMGIFDASLGQQARETSGIAIQRRAKESDNANFHFHDNEARSRRTLGRQLLELIPIVDEGEKTVPTRTEDGKTKLVRVNVPHRDAETGDLVHHDLAKGNYGVAVATGPSFTSQRQEAFDALSQIATADKNFMQIGGDIMFRNSDLPGADQLADRYEKILPPQLQPQKTGEQQNAQQQQQQKAQVQMLVQQHEQLVNTVHQLSQEIEAKTLELQSRERIVNTQEETKRVIAMATLDQKDGLSLLLQEVNVLKEKYSQQHAQMLQAGDQAHQAQLQQQQQAHEQQLADQQQQHQAGMQDADQQHEAGMQQAAAEQQQPAAEPGQQKAA